MIIKITKQGNLEMLYTDALPLRAIGRVSVRRASEVEYDDARGGWTVGFTDGGWLGADGELAREQAQAAVFRARAAALAAEVAYLEAWL